MKHLWFLNPKQIAHSKSGWLTITFVSLMIIHFQTFIFKITSANAENYPLTENAHRIIIPTDCITGTWVGTIDSKWEEPSNWCNGIVPTASTNVVIASAINQPTINESAYCKDITINSRAKLIISGSNKLTVNGNWINNGTFVANSSTVIFNGEAQAIGTGPYANLTIAGSGRMTISTVTVKGVLSMEGTSNLSATPTYESLATLQYNTTVARTAGVEWKDPFLALGGVIIANSGEITLNGPKTLNASVPLTIENGAVLNTSTNNYTLKFGGDFRNNGGTLTANASTIHIDNTMTDQKIDGFSTTGIVYMKKGSGTATLMGNISGQDLNINEIGGTLNLGINLTHTFSGTLKRNAGTLDGGSSTLRLGKGIEGIIAVFNTGTGTIEYFGAPININTSTYYNLIISGPGVKTIPPGSIVTVNGALDTNGLLVINSNATSSGSLVVKGASNGNVTYNRWLDHTNTNAATSPGYSRWYIAAAPVNVTGGFATNAEKIHQDANANNVYDFGTYTEPLNDWDYVADIPSNLDPGRGYLISLKPESDGIIQFTGTLNNEEVPIWVTRKGGYNGWNAIGNPYTSVIKVAGAKGSGSFLDHNLNKLDPDYAAIYVWNETEFYDGTQQHYRIIGNSGYISPLTGISLLNGVVSIQAGQGFLIKAREDGNISFNKAMQVHLPSLSLKSSEGSWPGFTLLAQSHDQTRSTVVAFNEQMTIDLDVTYDVGLLASDEFQVYTHLTGGGNGVDFAIQCLPDSQYCQLTVPVGVDLPQGGELIFKVAGLILPLGLYPVIEDKQLNIKTALKTESDSYIVDLPPNTQGTGRFFLSVAGIDVGSPTVQMEKKFTASLANGRMVIYGDAEPGIKALLFDLSGHQVGQYLLQPRHHNEIAISNLTHGIYILKIEGRNYRQSIKLVADR